MSKKFIIAVSASPDEKTAIGPFLSERRAEEFLREHIDKELAADIMELVDPKDIIADEHWRQAQVAARAAVQECCNECKWLDHGCQGDCYCHQPDGRTC